MHFFRQREGSPDVGEIIEVPAGIVEKSLLFDFYSKSFHFPDWFGYNWDAFLDCLRDVKDSFSQISIRHSDIPFTLNPKDRESYLDILLLTCTLHRGDVIVSFPRECLNEIDDIILTYWKSQSPDIKTKEDVLAIVSRIVVPGTARRI